MTEQEARINLQGRLVFGNDAQIRAIRFLDAVQGVVDQILESPECSECEGNGRVYECDADCEYCEGGCDECESLESCLVCGGLGHFVMDWPACRNDVMAAAIARIKRLRP